MRYELQPDQPRPWAAIHVGVAPRADARWRYVIGDVIDCTARHRATTSIDGQRNARERERLQHWQDEHEAAEQREFEQLLAYLEANPIVH